MKQPAGQIFQVRRGLALLLVMFVAGCGSPEERAQSYYESGMALIEKKDDLEARKELLKAVKYKNYGERRGGRSRAAGRRCRQRGRQA
jgi:hypothetical protein